MKSKMVIRTIFVVFLAMAAVLAEPINDTFPAIQKGNSLFANDLYEVMTKIEPGNLVISPYSLSTILAMVRSGAGVGSTTASEIQNGLHLETLSEAQVYDGFSHLAESIKGDSNVTIETANSVFVDKAYDIRDEFLDLLRNKFSAGAEALDFSDAQNVAKKINTFVKDVTRNTILELITADAITKDTKAVLVNAIYFKGLWANPFNVNKTTSAPFYTSEENSVQVDMMNQNSKFLFAKLPELNASAALLPYLGERFALVVVRPNERTGLNHLESKLKEFPLASIPGKLQETLLYLSLPRFKLESTTDFVRNKALENLGMKTVVSRKADFSRISSGNELYLSQILQKAVIDINEEGTKATAATAAIFINRVAQVGVPFNVNHPFIAFVYDSQTQTILFVCKKVK